jgi:5'-nucleotidase
LSVVAVVVAAVAGSPMTALAAAGDVPVQLIAINDFHGHIALPAGAEGRLVTGPGPDGVWGKNTSGAPGADDEVVQVGGAMYLASTVQARQAEFRREAGGSAASFFVSAGDVVGKSPPVSGDYRDEPAIEAMNAMGLDVSAVGDDELSRGTQELRRISAATDGAYTDDVTACAGVTPGVDGCYGRDAHAFPGARFPYVAANVVSRRTGEPMFPPYQVLYTPTGARIGLIGVVTPRVPVLVPAAGITDVTFIDEADAVNRWVRELRADGIEAIGVLMHDGGNTTGPAAANPDGCDGLAGPVLDLNDRIDPAVDLIMSGYTHGAYVCRQPVRGGEPRLVTQAGAYGRLVTDIRLTLDPRTGDVLRSATYSAANVPVMRTDADPRLQSLVDYWTAGPTHQPPAGPPGTAAVPDVPAPQTSGRLLGTVILGSVAAAGIVGWLLFRKNLRRRVSRQPAVPDGRARTVRWAPVGAVVRAAATKGYRRRRG